MSYEKEMEDRIANGEFGSPTKPDLQMVNRAWAELMEREVANRGGNLCITESVRLGRIMERFCSLVGLKKKLQFQRE